MTGLFVVFNKSVVFNQTSNVTVCSQSYKHKAHSHALLHDEMFVLSQVVTFNDCDPADQPSWHVHAISVSTTIIQVA